ncbi:MAG: AAA family ATPase, partial [Pseudomonadota bacterium]
MSISNGTSALVINHERVIFGSLDGKYPSDEQWNAVEMVQSNPISILTGGPGTGKTFTIRLILNWALSRDMFVMQAGPTGKAAKRMMESTEYTATTIHVMLGCKFVKGVFHFIHNRENPLPADLIILDEVSMISLDLMASVIQAIDLKRTKLVLVGDQDQLPSVGPGAVLRDLLSAGAVPHTELTEVFRNCGEIVRVCHLIK